MGEYARFNGSDIKIGTCESMYYLRYEDRNRVQALSHSLNPATSKNLFWRLPFPDEDNILPGHYKDYRRGLRMYRMVKDHMGRDYAEDFTDQDTIENPGIIQLRHENSGLLLNVPCYHGVQLPNVQKPMQAFWNGKGHSFELAHIKNLPDGTVVPVVHCRHCGHMWRYTWAEVLPFVGDETMRKRLEVYAGFEVPA